MNKLDLDYQNLLKDILENGTTKETRNGGTISVFGRQIRHKMSEGFPLLTTKRMAWKTMVTELLWFLRGETNIKFLVDNGCHIWDGDCYQAYLKLTSQVIPFTKDEFINHIKNNDEFAHIWGELGPIYGKQWRGWGSSIIDDLDDVYTKEVDYDIQNGKLPQYSSNRKFVIDEIKKHSPRIDQIANLINDLKTNPDSRRLMVSAWNVGELDQMVLPPCHYGFQVYTRDLSMEERVKLWMEKQDPRPQFIPELLDLDRIPTKAISLMWNQRSVDTFLGLPFNIASYGLLLEIIAKEVNMVPDELIGNLGDVHLYSNHVEQAKEQIGRKLTVEERMDWWFKNRKPNRDVCDDVDTYSPYAKGVYFDSIGVPKTTREPYPLPTLKINPNNEMRVGGGIFTYVNTDFTLENYQSHPTIKALLSN